MALNMDQLKQLLNAQGLHYYLDPQRDAAMLTAAGHFGQYQCVIALDLDGTFLQIRSVNYAHCPSENPNLVVVSKVLGEINYRTRGVKLGWDPRDGEITVYVDAWLQDGTVTNQQFGLMIQLFFAIADGSSLRLLSTIETGKDPGDISIENISEVLQRADSSLPPAIKAMLEQVRSKQGTNSSASDMSHI